MASSQDWIDALVAAGHTPAWDDDGNELDVFFLSVDMHNGPGCSACYDNWCEHCDGPEAVARDGRCRKAPPLPPPPKGMRITCHEVRKIDL